MVSSVDTTELANNPSDVERVFRFADTTMLRRMMRHAIKVIEGMVYIKDSVYFMALSDQIHFFGSYSAVMLIRLINTVRDSNTEFSLANELVIKALNLSNQLADKFTKLGQGQPNLATKYANSIRETLIMCNLV